MPMKQRTTLTAGWKWRLANSHGVTQADKLPSIKTWNEATSSPSVIHMELLAKDLIVNPNIGENERQIQWVGEMDWEYSCSFATPDNIADFDTAELNFEGLDTFATVTLNGKEILKTDNMFIPHRIQVNQLLKAAGEVNELSIVFASAVRIARELEIKYGERKSHMRDKKRMHIRKAQYQWGWDWGPTLMTAGPYMPIHLEIYSTRIKNIHVVTSLKPDHSSAEVKFSVQTSGGTGKNAIIRLSDKQNQEVARCEISLEPMTRSSTISIPDPKLWWPNGQGDQYLYNASVTILDSSSKELDTGSVRFGIRTIKVIQRSLDNAPGKTFMFNVNGRDIFCQGGNWIPADMLLPTVTRKRYFDWMKLAKYNHLNMIRVWGGGIYENEDFFDACDEMGMLVWHDYAFACGDYPIHQEFLDSTKKEVEVQTIRLRNRTCLAIIAGGNEDFMLNDWDGVKYDVHDLKGPFENTNFPQRKIYLQLLPKICEELCPEIQYWPNSPWGGDSANDPTEGDIHQWSVWHQDQKSYQQYSSLSGRFVSEFGMHGFPIMRTVDVFAPNPRDRHPQSRTIDCHNKGQGAETRIARYLAENFRCFNLSKLEDFVYLSQLCQSEAYGYALRDWKRKFKGKGKEECAGAIIWQLNDVYPCTSWAYVDFYLRPKPAFYTIRREFAEISVGVARTPRSRWIDEDHPPESQMPAFEIFAHNTTQEDVKCVLELRAYEFSKHHWIELDDRLASKPVTLSAGYNTELGSLGGKEVPWTDESLIILEASLIDTKTGRTLSRIVDWPEPFRYLHWPGETEVKISVSHIDQAVLNEDAEPVWEDRVTVVANHPVKGCWLEPCYDGTETEDVLEPLWENNMFDLMPGMEVMVTVQGLRGREVKARFLYDWELVKGE